MKRLGLGNIAAWNTTTDGAEIEGNTLNDVPATTSTSGTQQETDRIRGSISGGLWAWWSGESGGDSRDGAVDYLERLKKHHGKMPIQDLISLRVQLSTARLSFLVDFVDIGGINTLNDQLSFKIASHAPTSTTTQILSELVKCLRLIMNTEVSFLGIWAWNLSDVPAGRI